MNRAKCNQCAFINVCEINKKFPTCPCLSCLIKMICVNVCADAEKFYNLAHTIRIKIEDEEDRFKNKESFT